LHTPPARHLAPACDDGRVGELDGGGASERVGDPGRIMVAGDWHGNAEWAVHVIRMAGKVLEGESVPLIIHCGDFGVWPGPHGADYLEAVRRACSEHGVFVRFVDGNHEDFPQLEQLRARERWDGREDGDWLGFPADRAPVAWIPRGYRWQWHGRTWLALGGGVSLDRAIRTEGRDWWPQEEITWEQALEVMQAGTADVLVSHDCPAGVVHAFPPPPSFWSPRDLRRNELHRDRLQRVVDATRPRWIAHGHLHRAYQRTCHFGYGPVEVTGLDCDEGNGANWAVLDVEKMTWGEP
jgi:Calcineurin-like phosphoesterase